MAALTRRQRRESRERASRTFQRAQSRGPQFHQGSAGLFGRDAAGTSPLQAASDEWQKNRKIGMAWKAGAALNAAQPQAPMYPQYNGPQYSLDDFMGEANDYMSSYRNNINASRKQIEEQFQLAFADATTREGISQGVVASLPAELQAIYGGASATIDKEGAASLATQQGHNTQSFEGAGEGAAGQKAAMTAAFASRKADVPMLAAGVTSQVNRQKGALGQAKFERQGELDRAAAEMEVQFTKEQGNARREYMMAQQARQWSIEDRNFAAEQDARMARENQPIDNFERDRAAAKEDEQDAWDRDQGAISDQEQALAIEKLRNYSGADVSKGRARAMRSGNEKEFDRISNSSNMRAAEKLMRDGGGGDRFGRFRFTPSASQVAKSLEDRKLYRLASIFRLRNM